MRRLMPRRSQTSPTKYFPSPHLVSMTCNTPIEKVPNEILLHSTSYLCRKDILQLALVSKRFGNISQNAFYKTVHLELPGAERRVLFLLRTLLDRPDLAQSVRTLHISQYNPYHERYNEIVHWNDHLVDATALDQRIRQSRQDFAGRDAQKWHEWLDGKSHQDYTAMVVLLLPSMTNLSLDYEAATAISNSFRRFPDRSDQSARPRLQLDEIRTLEIPVALIPEYLSQCPRLDKLSLNSVTLDGLFSLIYSPIPSIECEISSLNLRIIDFGDNDQDEWANYLSHLGSFFRSPSLKHLGVSLWLTGERDPVFGIICRGWPEIVSLRIHDDDFWLSGQCQESMPPFQNLRQLSIQFGFLVTGDLSWPVEQDISVWKNRGFTSISKSLPSTLVILNIEDIDNDIVPWLMHMSQCTESYPNLKLIEATSPREWTDEYDVEDNPSMDQADHVKRMFPSDEIQSLHNVFSALDIALKVDLSMEYHKSS
ncbi:hypothetical protein K491DRAFT_157440 [Lophiostoma macrostomum CBS 122681]|uniref:F-box domain-containing protein n=1 Tax=Lophiostoma macrostomum CBS 122681 TaxID=1314788 RepID=A0A6A6SQ54_9PLEO|nr:hypothetical protein K491DRAFT_157440 [Lophiostoma macrostomum CBS 122681]